MFGGQLWKSETSLLQRQKSTLAPFTAHSVKTMSDKDVKELTNESGGWGQELSKLGDESRRILLRKTVNWRMTISPSQDNPPSIAQNKCIDGTFEGPSALQKGVGGEGREEKIARDPLSEIAALAYVAWKMARFFVYEKSRPSLIISRCMRCLEEDAWVNTKKKGLLPSFRQQYAKADQSITWGTDDG